MGVRGRTIAAALALLVLLSGCARVGMDLQLRPDNTVDGTIVMAVPRETAQTFGVDSDKASWKRVTTDLAGNLPAGARQEPYDDPRFVGTRVFMTDVPMEELTRLGEPDGLRIVRDGSDSWSAAASRWSMPATSRASGSKAPSASRPASRSRSPVRSRCTKGPRGHHRRLVPRVRGADHHPCARLGRPGLPRRARARVPPRRRPRRDDRAGRDGRGRRRPAQERAPRGRGGLGPRVLAAAGAWQAGHSTRAAPQRGRTT